LRSDAHVGEKVDPKWVQGIGSYNIDIYKSRLKKWLEKIILFKEQDEKSLGLNKLVIMYLGDMVTGESIYKGQSYFIDLNLAQQLFLLVEEESNAILKLAEYFNEIEIDAVWGNHGRIGRKGENHPQTNFDYIFYRALKMALSSQNNVNIYVSECPTMLIRHGNYNFSLNHNDNVRAWNGIPYYGLQRKIYRLNRLYDIKIHYMMGGHFHTPGNIDDEIYLNGSMVGGTDLSINKMTMSSRASQRIYYFDKKFGINRESNLYLSEPVSLEADDKGIYTDYC